LQGGKAVRTDCNASSIHFTPLARQKIVAQFDGGPITSDAGAILLREVDRRLNLFDRVDEIIPDPRVPELITHTQRTLIAQRILAIACGWEDLNDHDRLRADPLMQVVTERGVDPDQPLGSDSTLCRLENRVTRTTCVELNKLLVELFIESFDGSPPEELTLDFDATDDPVHGGQEGRFFHGFHGGYCFLPLYVFCGSRLLVAYLRPSNIDAARHSRAILKLLVTRLRQVWPDVRLTVRADSGFCRWRMMRWCDRHAVDYVLGLARNSRLLEMSKHLTAQAEQAFEQTRGEKQRLFGEVRYAAGTWDTERRVIVKAEHLDKGSNPRFVVTSRAGDPQQLYDDLYCARGEMENRIKEQQLGLFADRTSCHAFVANQFRLLLSSFAYVLVEHLRRVGLTGTPLANAQASTIRTKLLKIGALVKGSVRRLVLHLSAAFPLADLFRQVVARLTAVRTASG
jgi:hypothetical protein